MTKKYTDEDVRELVETAEVILAIHSDRLGGAAKGRIRRALKPFHPDLEEELIEAMTEAYKREFYRSAGIQPDHSDQFDIPHRRCGIIAALAVVKEKGLPQ